MLRSIAYCEARVAEIDQEFKRAIAETRKLDPTLMATMKECKKVDGMLKAGFGSGDITPEDYLGILKEVATKD